MVTLFTKHFHEQINMEEYGMILCGLFFLTCVGTCLSNTINIPGRAKTVNGMNEYILFTQAQSWNTAKKVCTGIGGELATVDSFELLDQIQEEAAGPWNIDWDHMWNGLHRAADNSLIFQDCSPLDFDSVGITFFKDAHDYDYDATKQCLRLNKDSYRMEKHDCSTSLIFLCKVKSGTCQYNSVNTSAALVWQSNATSGSCQSVCDVMSGCYLAGNYLNSHCVLLKVPPGENIMFEKMCYSASTNSSDTTSYIGSDDASSIPTTCSGSTENSTGGSGEESSSLLSATAVECPSSSIVVFTSSEVICSTEVVTLTPSVNDVTVVVTSAVTDTVTEWLTETQILSLTEISTAILTSAETLTTTLTTMSVVNTCTVSLTPESSCVTEITSTNVFTTMADCPTVTPEYLTLTSSCQEQSVMISPTTVTIYESTSCLCETTSPPSEVVSFQPDTSFVTSASRLTTSPEPGPTETTICRAFNTSNVGEAILDALVASIIRDLTIETKNLSSTIRKKTSAQDSRVSSMSLGYGSVVLILIPFVIIFLADLPGIFRDCRKYLINIKIHGQP